MQRIILTTACIIVCLAAVAWAEGPTFSRDAGFVVRPSGEDDGAVRLDVRVGHVAEAALSDSGGEVAVTRGTLGLEWGKVRVSYGVSWFDWRDVENVSFSSGATPWETLHDVTVSVRLLDDRLGESWRYWVNGELASSFEADFPGAVGAGFDGGAAYEFWDGWMLGLTGKTAALSALSEDLFGDVELGLAVAVSEAALEKTLQSLGLMDSDGEKRQVGLSVAVSGARKTYRLSPDSPVQRNGYMGLVRSKVGAYLEYAPGGSWVVSVGPEYTYARKYSLFDSSGGLRSSHSVRPAWGGFFRAQYAF